MGDPARPEAVPARYPLSSQQAGCSEDPDPPSFILPFAMRIKGHVDTDALQGALDDLVERHDVLRTSLTFGADGEAGYQTVLPPSAAPFTVHDLDLDQGRSRDEVADDLLAAMYGQRMDLAELPLLRAALYRFDDQDAVLTILLHHWVGDGWSCNLLRRDLAACYRARTTGVPHDLPAARQYWEHGIRQREWLAGERATASRRYWRDKLVGAAVYTMPADRPNGEGVLRSPYAAANFVVEPDEFGAVEAHAASLRCSGWHALLAAGALLGERLRARPEITMMTNTSGRTDRAFNNTMGFFADFVPIRLRLDDCFTYQDVLLRSRSTCLEAYRNLIPITMLEQDTPTLPLPNDEPANMPFVFNYSRPLIGAEEIQFADGVELITPLKEEPGERGGWCFWTMWRHPSGALRGTVEYSPDLVDSGTVELWISGFVHLLSLITEAPHQNRKAR